VALNRFSRNRAKQKERKDRIDALPPEYRAVLTQRDQGIITHDTASLVAGVQGGDLDLDPEGFLLAYSKKALDAHGTQTA
jgi:hypothetical protein